MRQDVQVPAANSALHELIREELWFGEEDPRRTTAAASESLAAALGRTSGLRPFPAVASHLLSLLSEPSVHIGHINDAMEKDPIIAGKLLRLANTPAFRPRSPYTSLEQAIVRLGTQTVQELVAGIGAMRLFDDAGEVGSEIRDHCAGVAALARVLASEWGFRGVGRTFLAGLLHDLGKLLIHQVSELDYAALSAKVSGSADEVHILERYHLGYDHAVLGAHVLQSWNIPPDIVRIVAWHHQPGRAYAAGEDEALAVSFLRLADVIEHEARQNPEPDDEFFHRIEKHEANSYIGFSADVYQAMWPKMLESLDELLSVLVS